MNLVRQRRAESETAIQTAREQIDELYAEHKTLSHDAEDVEESRAGIKQRIEEIRHQLSVQRTAAQGAT